MKVLRNILLVLVVILILVGVAGFLLYRDTTLGPLPNHDGSVTIDPASDAFSAQGVTVGGLSDTVEIIRDEQGVPHIYASTPYDLFFAQGYAAAQDRWWQMEFSRATGDGRLQELTGANNALMGNDIFLRTAGWRRAAERDIAEVYDAETLELLQAFADGVNAYIFSRPQDKLAFEYRLLGVNGVSIDMRPWTPADSVVWSKAMAWNLGPGFTDQQRLQLIEGLSEDMYLSFQPGFSYDEKPTILTLGEIVPVSETAWQPAPTAAANPYHDSIARHYDALETVSADKSFDVAGNADPDALANLIGFEGIGSNSWVVNGDMSETGQPLLANDPHLGIQMPSIWYEVGLYCREQSDACPYNVRGYALPAIPGVVIGHNDRIAWGFTNVGPDVIDFYEIKVNPDNALQYEYNGEWVDMTVHEEVIRLGDSDEATTIQVRETRFGPIINDNQRDDDGNILGFNDENPLAMRWTALDPAQTLTANFGMMTASNWDEFRAAAQYFDAPSQNLLYADVDGNIGYQTPGHIPIRPASNSGLFPVDGATDENEWLGYVPFDLLPRAFNPEKGYIQTANQPVVPLEYYDWLAEQLADEYGDGDPENLNVIMSHDWADGYRGERIVELIEAQDVHTFESFMAIQGDNKFVMADEIMPFVLDVDMGSEDLNAMRDWLGEWDYMQDVDSPQAPLFGMFYAKLMNDLYDDQLEGITNAGLGSAWPTSMLMNAPDNIWWDRAATGDTVETRDDTIAVAFAEAVNETRARLGENRDEWTWGDIHIANFVSNPLGASGIDLIEDAVNRSVATGGGYAVNAAGFDVADEEFNVGGLASKRSIFDMSDLANSVNIHTTGQSGHPFSEHYDDFIDRWRGVEYKPMRYSREDVEANAVSTLVLEPAE